MKPIIEKYILFLLLIVLSIGGSFYFAAPKIQEWFGLQNDLKTAKGTVSDLTKNVELEQKRKIQVKENPVEKQIYEPADGTQASQAFDEMLETVLELAKTSGLKIKTINMNKAIESDPIKTNHATVYDAQLLSAQVIGTYTQLQTFLREVFRHEYLIGVKKIEITPYENDKKILIVNLDLSLYAKK